MNLPHSFLNPNRTGTLDTSMLDRAISDAEGDVSAAYGSRFNDITSNPSTKLVRIILQLVPYYAWLKGPKNLVMPELVKQSLWLSQSRSKRYRKVRVSPGGTPKSRFPTAVDNSQYGRRAVYSTWRRGGINGADDRYRRKVQV